MSSPKFETHLVASIGEETYVAMAKGPLGPSHVLVLPIVHKRCTLELSESEDKEVLTLTLTLVLSLTLTLVLSLTLTLFLTLALTLALTPTPTLNLTRWPPTWARCAGGARRTARCSLSSSGARRARTCQPTLRRVASRGVAWRRFPHLTRTAP